MKIFPYNHPFSHVQTSQEDDRVSKRRKTSRGEPGAFMMMELDSWKIFNAFMRKEAAKGKSLERNCWRFPEKSQVQAVKKKRSLLFSVRTLYMFIYSLFYTSIFSHVYRSCVTCLLVFDCK